MQKHLAGATASARAGLRQRPSESSKQADKARGGHSHAGRGAAAWHTRTHARTPRTPLDTLDEALCAAVRSRVHTLAVCCAPSAWFCD